MSVRRQIDDGSCQKSSCTSSHYLKTDVHQNLLGHQSGASKTAEYSGLVMISRFGMALSLVAKTLQPSCPKFLQNLQMLIKTTLCPETTKLRADKLNMSLRSAKIGLTSYLWPSKRPDAPYTETSIRLKLLIIFSSSPYRPWNKHRGLFIRWAKRLNPYLYLRLPTKSRPATLCR